MNSLLAVDIFSKCNIAVGKILALGEVDLDRSLILFGELLLDAFLEQTTLLIASLLAFMSSRPISLSNAVSSSNLFCSASASCFSLFNSLSSLTSSIFSLRKFLGEWGLLILCTGGSGGGRAAVAISSTPERELVRLLGDVDRELAADVLGVV